MLDSGAQVSKVDPAVFYWCQSTGEVYGILVCHVDDFIWGGNRQFLEVISKIRSIFSISKECDTAFKYCGIEIVSHGDVFYLDQEAYTNALSTIDIGVSRSSDITAELSEHEKHTLRSKIGQLLWLAHQSRPDILFDGTRVSNNVNSATIEDVLEVNKIIAKAKTTQCGLKFQRLDASLNDLFIAMYGDASLGNMPNGGSQGGYIVLLASHSGRFSPIWWNSKRIRRVVRSTLAAETLDLAEGIDSSIFYMYSFGRTS
ncbi:hypothetical protein HOLleu_03109 [Holothuria leucospilota]|uniref:Uncharacterized protein n=1 Tax=Holothuria leucospilota TaxID=206669 RepID=A0A9Q1CT92_HOLLE|nr:hypothetical protein HOLleu_03109 [Holothuria leucospilota]